MTTTDAIRLNVDRIRSDFPILAEVVNNRPLVYLDSAATAQKPRSVIDAIVHYYEHDNANIHRGVHTLSVRATDAYEKARGKIQRFIGAHRPEEIVFVRGATEGINLVAQAYARPMLNPGDEIIVSNMEHHSNIVPWQIVAEQTGAKIRIAPIGDDGSFLVDEFRELLNEKTKLVAVTHVSNALGTIVPVREVVAAAHEHQAVVVVDGAQAAPHATINVSDINCDFYTISSHKMFGPTGVGALYGKFDLLNSMQPYQGGGEMIKSVRFDGTIYNDVPHKFEAGTPNIAGSIGMGAAIDYLMAIGMDAIAAHEHELLEYGTELLNQIDGLKLIGTAPNKAAVLSFIIDGIHPHDIGTILDQQGIAVRTGHHCAQPVMDRFKVPATTRASLALYNNRSDLDALASGIKEVIEVFG
jgi:cysteine desulfurase/selenocysteine lyase